MMLPVLGHIDTSKWTYNNVCIFQRDEGFWCIPIFICLKFFLKITLPLEIMIIRRYVIFEVVLVQFFLLGVYYQFHCIWCPNLRFRFFLLIFRDWYDFWWKLSTSISSIGWYGCGQWKYAGRLFASFRNIDLEMLLMKITTRWWWKDIILRLKGRLIRVICYRCTSVFFLKMVKRRSEMLQFRLAGIK